MRKCWRNNGLTLTLLLMFAICWSAQVVAGRLKLNDERRINHQAPLTLTEYVASGEFWSATGENWESEFLQMFFFIWLSAFLYQKGSPESNDPDHPEQERIESALSAAQRRRAPWPVRRGGWVCRVYAHSLSLAFLALFIISFAVHVVHGARNMTDERIARGDAPVTALEYLATSRMWFESMQNWQSEFLSVAAMVYFAVYLREKGSPESKRVASAHDEHH
ncbi:MAG: hypothetical protein JNG88_04605 [Phycisphaerales bacterium]|nr:hypothetical protein [Phycisphaerales bacterium]